MTAASLRETLVLGAVTGMRSMAGPATLALRGGGVLKILVPILAIGEMIADKSPAIGNRIDPLPLGGRAAMGALVGSLIAREGGENVLVGGLVGAATAVAAAHLAYQGRKRLPLSTLLGGLLEDALVIGIASGCVRRLPAADL